MTGTKSHKNKRFDEQRKRLFMKKSFKESILKYRNDIGIPKNGFSTNEKYKKWLNEDKIDRFLDIRTASVDLSKKFKLPINFSLLIEARLIMGAKYKQYNNTPPFETYSRGFGETDFSCAWEVDESNQCVVVQIFPGAVGRDIKDFFTGQNLRKITKALKDFENRVSPIRDSRKAERDKKIIKLRENGMLTALGLPSIKNRENIPDDILDMDSGTRRSVLQKHKRDVK